MSHHYKKLAITKDNFIAYHHTKGKKNAPSIVFLGGFMSDMQGTKATALEAYCKQQGYHFIRFDYFGHGQSSQKFTDGTIGKWKANVLNVIDNLTQGKQILIGSSMGGWLMCLASLERPTKIAALIGIASAPDFTQNLIWNCLEEDAKNILSTEGVYHLKSDYGDAPYPITHTLIEEARNHLILNKKSIPIECPIHLIHGMKDDDVPYHLSISLAEKIVSQHIQVHLLKNSDHRMSSKDDIHFLLQTLEETITTLHVV